MRTRRSPVVYFIGYAGRIKIGYTANLDARLSIFKTTIVDPIEVLGTIPGGRSVEHSLHERFSAHHESGEWFRDVPELRAAIVDLIAMTPKPAPEQPPEPSVEVRPQPQPEQVDPEAEFDVLHLVFEASFKRHLSFCSENKALIEALPDCLQPMVWGQIEDARNHYGASIACALTPGEMRDAAMSRNTARFAQVETLIRNCFACNPPPARHKDDVGGWWS